MDFREMSETDIGLALLSGKPFMIDNLEIIPKLLSEVQEIGYDNYLMSLQGIMLTKKAFAESLDENKVRIIEEETSESGKNTVFDYYIRYAGKDFLQLLGLGLRVAFSTDDIILEGERILIDSSQRQEDSDEPLKIVSRDNFDWIIKALKLQNNFALEPKEEEQATPKNERARKLREDMERANREIEARKARQNQGNSIPFDSMISAITTRSHSINKFNIWNLTIAQIYDEFDRINAIDRYDLNIQAMLAGADIDDLKHWASKSDEED